jgi:hypothetical protein
MAGYPSELDFDALVHVAVDEADFLLHSAS